MRWWRSGGGERPGVPQRGRTRRRAPAAAAAALAAALAHQLAFLPRPAPGTAPRTLAAALAAAVDLPAHAESAASPSLSSYAQLTAAAAAPEAEQAADAADGLPAWAQVLVGTVVIVGVIGVAPTFMGMGLFGAPKDGGGAGEGTRLPVKAGGAARDPIGEVDKALSPFASDGWKGVTFGEFSTLTAADVEVGEPVMVRDLGEWQKGTVYAIKNDKVYVKTFGPVPMVWSQIKRAR